MNVPMRPRRKIIFQMSISLDGFFAGPNEELDWQLIDEELHQHFNDEARTMGAFLDGRVTHELMVDYWPTADTDPDSPPQIVEFAGIWRDMPKVVFSTTLVSAGWNTTISREVDPDEIERLRDESGGDLGVGGAVLARSFMRHDLIDELRIYVHPIAIGRGRPLFPLSDREIPLTLLETRRFSSGVVLLRYATDSMAA